MSKVNLKVKVPSKRCIIQRVFIYSSFRKSSSVVERRSQMSRIFLKFYRLMLLFFIISLAHISVTLKVIIVFFSRWFPKTASPLTCMKAAIKMYKISVFFRFSVSSHLAEVSAHTWTFLNLCGHLNRSDISL